MVSMFDVTVSEGFDHKEEIFMLGNFLIMNKCNTNVHLHSIGTVVYFYNTSRFVFFCLLVSSTILANATQTVQNVAITYKLNLKSAWFFTPKICVCSLFQCFTGKPQ